MSAVEAATPLAGEGPAQHQAQQQQGVEISTLSINPITTPSCSVPGSHKSSRASSTKGSSGGGSSSSSARLRTPPHPPGSLSPKLTIRTPLSSTQNSVILSTAPAAIAPALPRSTTPRSQTSSAVHTPIRDHSPRLPTPPHHPPFASYPHYTKRRATSIHSHDGSEYSASSKNVTPTSTSASPLSSAVSRILSSRPSSARACACHVCPNPAECRHVCACHVGPRTASRELRFGGHHQVEPYARSRKADPQGYLFTCYLDYSRCIKPPPPACFNSYVRPESLQYSTCSSACETPRSSTALPSFISVPAERRCLYSRPPTPAPLIRAKEVHRLAMAGVPVDVKELANCYLFVAEIPGLKNTDVKVQVENDSILKISGERRREECEECEIKYVRIERQAGRFARKFNLPVNVDLENISAACQDGLLSVVVPKNPPLEQRRPKNFDVKIST